MSACPDATAPGSGLEVRALHCERAGRALIAALDLSVERGAALVIAGPNGSGKTTLLRALAGLSEAQSERIAWDGDVADARSAPWRSRIAYAGHKQGLKEELSVGENLALACALEAIPVDARTGEQALERTGLASRRGMAVKRLSQGQKQRLTLARLCVTRRPLWLLDEPQAALDTAARELLNAIVHEHLQRRGVALIASHDVLDLPVERAAWLTLAGPTHPARASVGPSVAYGAQAAPADR